MVDTATAFRNNGFTFVKNVIDTSSYYTFINKLVDLGKGNGNDNQVPGSKGFYKEPIFEKLLIHLLPDIERYSGFPLYKTYSYARQYHLGEELKIHKDRHACEITVSLCLGNEAKPWPIWIRDKEKQPHVFEMEAGDAVIFRGIDLKHWREPNTFGGCANVFLHYVDREGQYADEKDDMKNRKGGHGY